GGHHRYVAAVAGRFLRGGARFSHTDRSCDRQGRQRADGEASGFDPELRHRPPPHPVPGRISTSARRRRGDRYRILAEDPSDADSAANTGYTASTGGDFHGCTDQFTAFKEQNDENPASH